jgi:hypothetical protein
MVSRVLFEAASFHSLTVRSHLHRYLKFCPPDTDEEEASSFEQSPSEYDRIVLKNSSSRRR